MRNRNQKLIAERIRELRGDKTQNEVAELLHITQAYLSEIERGKKVPSKALLFEIAEKFNTTVSYLIGETNTVILPERLNGVGSSAPVVVPTPRDDDAECILLGVLEFNDILEACRVGTFVKKMGVHIYVPMADIGERYSESNLPFVLKLSGGNNRLFGFPDGSRAVINPEDTLHNFDIALVYYNGDLALKKIMNKDDEIELISFDGSKICVSDDEALDGDFKIFGKLTSVTLTPNHGF